MAFYTNPNGIPRVPPFGRKGAAIGPQPHRTRGPGGDGNPTDNPETQKDHPVPDQQDEVPTFLRLFANLVGMRTPMAPEGVPNTTGNIPEVAPEADQEETA